MARLDFTTTFTEIPGNVQSLYLPDSPLERLLNQARAAADDALAQSDATKYAGAQGRFDLDISVSTELQGGNIPGEEDEVGKVEFTFSAAIPADAIYDPLNEESDVYAFCTAIFAATGGIYAEMSEEDQTALLPIFGGTMTQTVTVRKTIPPLS